MQPVQLYQLALLLTARLTEAKVSELGDKIYASVDEIVASGASEVEYAVVDGFKPGSKVRIGSVTAGTRRT